ncbi:hypothetical protein KBT16_31690 [Nostoc sp. CCCryo 231-06]|nr:hypothetical protein [Nostoc sp. CCCryo 231-06]
MLFWQRYWLHRKQFFTQRVFRLLLYCFYYGFTLIIIFVFTLVKHSIPVAAQNPVSIVAPQKATSQTTAKSPTTQTRCKINAYVMRLNDFNFTEDSFFID